MTFGGVVRETLDFLSIIMIAFNVFLWPWVLDFDLDQDLDLHFDLVYCDLRLKLEIDWVIQLYFSSIIAIFLLANKN